MISKILDKLSFRVFDGVQIPKNFVKEKKRFYFF